MNTSAIGSLFGRNLAFERHRAALSQDGLALRTSLNRTEISNLERGHRIPRIDTLARLCGGLDVGPAELMAGIEWLPGSVEFGRYALRGRDEG